MFRMAVPQQFLQETIGVCNDLLKSGAVEAGTDKPPFCTAQREPKLQLRFSTLGRVKDWAEKNQMIQGHLPETLWSPSFVVSVTLDGEQKMLVTVNENSQLEWDESSLKKVGFANVAEAIMSFSRHRRQ